MRTENAEHAKTVGSRAPDIWRDVAQVLPAAIFSVTAIAPMPFFWNAPAWILALTHPTTSRAATLLLVATHPWLAPSILKAIQPKEHSDAGDAGSRNGGVTKAGYSVRGREVE